MPDVGTLLFFAAAALAFLAIPGPSVFYVVARSVTQGRRAGLVSVLGVQTGGAVHVVAAAFGLSALIASSAEFFSFVKYAGAAYLIFLGVRKLRSRAEASAGEPDGSVRGPWSTSWSTRTLTVPEVSPRASARWSRFCSRLRTA
jgi:threonine/homoserine/homoserine lactone efflux protein